MALPQQKEIELPLLFEITAMGGQAKPQDMYPRVTAHFPSITDADLDERLKGGENRWSNLIQFARQRLVEKNELDKSTWGIWQITHKGKSRLASSNILKPPAYPFAFQNSRVLRTGAVSTPSTFLTSLHLQPTRPAPPDEPVKLAEEIEGLVKKLAELAGKAVKGDPRPTHDAVVERVKELGQMLGKTAEVKPKGKYPYEFDCIWKDNQWANPRLTVEVCDKGNLDKDIASLTWAIQNLNAKGLLILFEDSDFQAAQKKLPVSGDVFLMKVDDMVIVHSLLKAGNIQSMRCVFGV